MLSYQIFSKINQPTQEIKLSIIDFLYEYLGQYGDPKAAIKKCVDYSLCIDDQLGGHILCAYDDSELVGVVVINKTGMKEYIPENILVYIATKSDRRGQGIGTTLLNKTIENVDGNIALHVEPENPAKKLYESLGFTNKYLEMRLNK